ncbi:MAG TPA: hypothetical protein VKB09_12645 [Thermomicrobiales bacterium]|nr:hypothetical protein [Thermomicrobiales bacterium]
MTIFELWDERTGRAIGRWPTEAEALAVVRDLLDRGEVLTVAALVLRSADWGSAPETIAAGAELGARARKNEL